MLLKINFQGHADDRGKIHRRGFKSTTYVPNLNFFHQLLSEKKK